MTIVKNSTSLDKIPSFKQKFSYSRTSCRSTLYFALLQVCQSCINQNPEDKTIEKNYNTANDRIKLKESIIEQNYEASNL